MDPIAKWRAAMAQAGYALSARARVHPSTLLSTTGDVRKAEVAFRQLIEAMPDHIGALQGLVYLLQRTGRSRESERLRLHIAALRVDALGIEAADKAGATRFLGAAEGVGRPPTRAPRGYVRGLFDAYAETYDESLLERLHYRGPELLYQALENAACELPAPVRGLDLGCGTGLAGERFSGLCEELHGVDLSPRMLGEAAARGVYDRLDEVDLVTALRERPDAYSLIVAADVLPYFGDLEPVLAAARDALCAQGVLLFSLEAGEAAPRRLRSSGRFQHGEAYVRGLLDTLAMEIRHFSGATVRSNHGKPVAAHIVCARRSAHRASGSS